MTEEISIKYLTKNIRELQELYNKFIEQYKIRLTGNTLIIKERGNNSGINISPEEGEIYGVISLKPASELEFTLKENDTKGEFLLFQSKDSKFILLNYNNKFI
jgi:hypothetical protein